MAEFIGRFFKKQPRLKQWFDANFKEMLAKAKAAENEALVANGELAVSQADISALNSEKASKRSLVTTANATDLASAITLINALKAKINAMNA